MSEPLEATANSNKILLEMIDELNTTVASMTTTINEIIGTLNETIDIVNATNERFRMIEPVNEIQKLEEI